MSSDLRIDFSDMLPPVPSGTPDQKGGGAPDWRRRLFWSALLIPFALVVPFAIVLRGTLGYQNRFDMGTLPALTLGLVTAAVFLALVAWIIARLLRFPAALRVIAVRGSALAVFGLAGMSMLWIAAENVKSAELTAEYRTLHPLLRLATATLILVDDDAVLTDASRTVDDYAAWGLPANEASLHFIQDDGWAHAMDLRTAGRPEWRNWLTRTGLGVMGFSTLRHTGTADHLHVSIPRR